MVKNKKMILVVGAVIVVILLLCCLFLGKKDRYEGYYIMEGRPVYALCVNKDGTVTYSSNKMNWACSTGYIEIGEDRAALYFDRHLNPEAYVERFCPLYMTLSEDGKRMYLSSDNSDWYTDTFDVVDKEEYETFAEEYGLTISIDN